MSEMATDSFKFLNRWLMIPMWRLGLGRLLNAWPSVGGQIMVLVNTGRKSGLRRYTPLNYASSPPSSVFAVAGFGSGTDWYRNVIANPAVELWLPGKRWMAEVVDISDDPLRLSIVRQVLIASGYAAVLAGVDPRTLGDEALADATKDYKLIEVQYRADATGSDGPGDLIWVWPLVAFMFLADRFRRNRGQRS